MSIPNLVHPLWTEPRYEGPDSGLAFAVHHNVPYEWCWSFRERGAAIRRDKPPREWAAREYCLLRLGPAGQPWEADGVRINAEQERLYTEMERLYTEIERLYTEMERLYTERERLVAERDRLIAEQARLIRTHRAALDAQVRANLPDLDRYWNGHRLMFPDGGP